MRAFIITLAAVAAGAAAMADTPRSHDAAVARNLNTFNTIVKELELNYVDSISTDAGFEAAIAAMLSTVDPYTEYYTADDQDVLMRITPPISRRRWRAPPRPRPGCFPATGY